MPESHESAFFGKSAGRRTFAQRLAKENTLYAESAEGVEAEYRRWLYLCAVAGRRLQGSDWMTKAELAHRKDPANWHALVEVLPPDCLAGQPAHRSRANGTAYSETLAIYRKAFPAGPKFPKVWPARWREDAQLWMALVPLLGVFGGGALAAWASGPVASFGGLCVLLGVALMIAFCMALPWQDDDSNAW
jgi:hypothetical protein